MTKILVIRIKSVKKVMNNHLAPAFGYTLPIFKKLLIHFMPRALSTRGIKWVNAFYYLLTVEYFLLNFLTH